MNIYESIAAIQADVDFIGKDKQTTGQTSYKYRGVDQVLNTLHPLFSKHKVFAVPEVLEVLSREWKTTKTGSSVVYQTAKVKYTFYAEDGSSVSAIVLGEAMDSGDKASNKCMSVAYKYACFQILSIPTEETTEDPDDDAEAFAKPASSAPLQNPAAGTKKPVGQEKEHVPDITPESVSAAGIQDPEKMIDWLEGKIGYPVAMFSEEERAAAWKIIKRQVAKNAGKAQESV